LRAHTEERALTSGAASRLREPDERAGEAGAGMEPLADTRGTLLTVIPAHDGRSFLAIVGYLVPSPLPRRTGRAAVETASGLMVDRVQHRVLLNGEDVELLFQEFELLEFLTKRPDRAFTREQILAGAWGGRLHDATTRTVDVHIHRLRRKLGPVYAEHLVTVRRVGYMYRTPPRATHAERFGDLPGINATDA
jgi:DNA-binding winged helix-turn-helix (wHTH) protein